METGGESVNGQGSSKPMEKEQPIKIPISIKSQDGDIIHFRTVRNKKIQNLLKEYCKQKGFSYPEICFLHNGSRIQPTKTLIALGIEENDEIDAMQHQTGGGNPTTSA